jgi:carbamoyltransferase
MANIAFYGSHNAALVVEQDGEIILVLEVERFNSYKNSGVAQFKVPQDPFSLMQHMMDFIRRNYGISEFENCLSLNVDSIWGDKKIFFDKFIPAKNIITHNLWHHESHAANAFYQSPHQEAVAFSFDGGGNDGFFNVYHCKRETGCARIGQHNHDFGFPYMVFGQYLKDVKYEPSLSDGNLVYPGKLMGLVSFGNVIDEWVPHFMHLYKKKIDGINYKQHLDILGNKIGVFFSSNRIEGQLAWDIATTSQRAFEECFIEIARPYLDQYPGRPICITGGCGLNILLNTRLQKEFGRPVFVGPSPNDCGLATGMMLNYLKPQKPPMLTYTGLPLLDIDTIARYYQYPHTSFDLMQFVDRIKEGKIIGVARGNSEHGPRALGNRSILCDPSFPEMKDVLNKKVKHREWYRPFAPVVRLEDVNKFFEWEGESQFMTFAPLVREQWREKLQAITHIDNTARVQTVTREQNEWLYDILTEMDRRTGVGVLLNTSFNVDGQPILTTIKDAFHVFQNSQMDGLLINDLLFSK